MKLNNKFYIFVPPYTSPEKDDKLPSVGEQIRQILPQAIVTFG
jgi:hypothetical protein